MERLIINIMQNQQIKQQIERLWQAIKSSKAAQLDQLLSISKEKAFEVIGINDIQKIRHSSLLQLLIYELILFADEKMRSSPNKNPIKGEYAKTADRPIPSLARLNQIKELVCSMSTSNSTDKQIMVNISNYKTLLQKMRSLQREILREEEKKMSKDENDSQGTQIMIQQLQQIIRRKQNRIRELNLELQQNFNDKQQLQQQIDQLQYKNGEFTSRIETLQNQIEAINNKHQQLQDKHKNIQEQFEKYKSKQKQQLLFGVSSFMNHQLKHRQTETNAQDTTLQEESRTADPISNSTKILHKYFAPPPREKITHEEKTVKKKPFKMIASEDEQEEDLLLSMKGAADSGSLENEDHSLERMVLMQALLIESALRDMEG